MIDITMTATQRPNILDKTLESFSKNIFNERDRYRLIINIDPIGEDCSGLEIINICLNYFDTVFHFTEVPFFTRAVMYCWDEADTDYIFHLEDDWELLKKINIDEMIKILESDKKMASLRLNKEKTMFSEYGKRNGYVPFSKLSLNPTLIKKEFIKGVLPLMEENLNPEKQLRVSDSERGKFISKWTHGIYVKESFDEVVRDLGRPWMENTRFCKKIGFMKWENK